VVGLEQRQEWSQAGLTFTLRIDRIDQLDDGRIVLLDYKTGDADANDWLGDRPQEPQMLLYATALNPAPAAVSFALLNTEGCSFDGLSSHPPALPKLEVVADWGAQLASWRKVLTRLAQSFASGDARVDPLARQTCDRCHLHTLCRIDEVRAARWGAAS
jgi:RecB family exonuclease